MVGISGLSDLNDLSHKKSLGTLSSFTPSGLLIARARTIIPSGLIIASMAEPPRASDRLRRIQVIVPGCLPVEHIGQLLRCSDKETLNELWERWEGEVGPLY